MVFHFKPLKKGFILHIKLHNNTILMLQKFLLNLNIPTSRKYEYIYMQINKLNNKRERKKISKILMFKMFLIYNH